MLNKLQKQNRISLLNTSTWIYSFDPQVGFAIWSQVTNQTDPATPRKLGDWVLSSLVIILQRACSQALEETFLSCDWPEAYLAIKKIYIHLKRSEGKRGQFLGSFSARRKFVFALTFVPAFKKIGTYSRTDFIHYIYSIHLHLFLCCLVNFIKSFSQTDINSI